MRKLLTISLLTMAIHAAAQLSSYRLPADNIMNPYHVCCVTQDKTGFIWLGSTNGLYRFEGYNYQKVQPSSVSNLLPDESVVSMENWGDRYLWIMLRGKQYACYDVEVDRFVSWAGQQTNDASYKRYTIADSHHLWLYDDQQGCRHVENRPDGTFHSQDYSLQNKLLPSNHVRFVVQEKNGRAWVGTDQGLVQIQIASGSSTVTGSGKDFCAAQQLADGSCYFLTDTAYHGEEALEKIRQQRPDLVVSDVKMPVMGGIELVQRIRQDEELSDLPVILLTAIADEERQVRGTKHGADDYLFKPFNPKMLVAKCAALIEQRERLRQKYAKEVVGTTPLADIIVEDADKKFLERFESWVYGHLDKPDMQAIDFANSMKMGRTTFFKKVKQVTGMPPHEYIRKIRFNRAAELLQDPTLSVSEVAYQTGFEDPSYFSRSFKEYFGITASQFRKGERPAQS